MITTSILFIFYYVAYGLLSAIPSVDLMPDAFNESITWAFERLGVLVSLLPHSDDLVIIFALTISVISGLVAYKVTNWVLNKMRGSG